MNERSYWTYIVASISGTLYIGMTNDLYKRIMDHKNGGIEGFSAKYRCNRLVWFEEFNHPSNAIAREKQLKGWRRSKKTDLIESVNPRWEDIALFWGKEQLTPAESIAEANQRLTGMKKLGAAI
jgi:putative endonuclease